MDFIRMQTTFTLIRTENGPKFESVLMRKVVSRIENEANVFFFFCYYYSIYILTWKTSSGPILPYLLQPLRLLCDAMAQFFSLAKRVIALTSRIVTGAPGALQVPK